MNFKRKNAAFSELFPAITTFYYLLLKSIKVSEPFALIMIFLSCSQSLSFLISSSYIIRIFSDDLSLIIYRVFSIFRPLYIINVLRLKSLYQFLLTLSLCYMVFYLLVIILIVKKNRKMNILLQIFKRLTYMNFYLWYIPLNEVLLTPVYCLSVSESTSVEELFAFELCIGGYWDYFLGFFGVLLWALMMVTCLMNVLFNIDMTYNFHNALAKSDSLMEIYTFLNKNLLIILLIFIRQLQQPLFFLIILLLLEITEILALREFFQKPNFINQKIEKFYGLTLTLQLFLSTYILMFTIINVFGGEWPTGLGLLLTILLPLRLYLNRFDTNYLETISGSFEKLKTPELVDKKIKLMYSYLKGQEFKKAQDPKKKSKFNINYNKNDCTVLYLWGYLFGHWNNCDNSHCFCRNEEDKLFDYLLNYEYRAKSQNPMKNFESLIYMKYFMRQQYKDTIFLLKNPVNLRLNLAYFNFFQLNNVHQALLEAFELSNTTETSANIHLKGLNYRRLFLIKRLELEIRDLIHEMNSKKDLLEGQTDFDIEKILGFEENFSFMEQRIAEFRTFYTKFFFKLSNNSISLEELEKDCASLLEMKNQIQEVFELIRENPRSIKLYLGYLNNLVFKNDQGYTLEKKLKELLEKIHANEGQNKMFYAENLIYTESSLVVQVGGEFKNLGKILNCNQACVKVLGYQRQELEFGNISMILPLRLQRFHDGFLEKYMRTGKHHLLFKEKSMFVRRKNGFLLSTAMIVKPSYDFQKSQFKFLGFLRPLKKATEFIVTDMYGTIDGMTENLSKLFNVHPKDYESGLFYIQVLCPKLYSFFIERNEKIHNIFMDGSRNSSVRTNKTNKTKKMKEIQDIDLMELLDIPKTLSNEAILRFYRYNHGELFGDLRSIINAIIEKLKRRKSPFDNFDELPLAVAGADSPKSSGLDKWNLIKRKFIKIAMMGNFFNCKTKINYFKSSDCKYEWLVFSITEIEFTRKLKIMQMANKSVAIGPSFNRSGTLYDPMNNSTNSPNNNFFPRVSDQYDPNVFAYNKDFSNIMNHIQTNPKTYTSTENPSNNVAIPNGFPAFERVPILKQGTIKLENINTNNINNNDANNNNDNNDDDPAKQENPGYTKENSIKKRSPSVQYIKEFASTGIEKIVIHHEDNQEDPEERESLIIATESSLNIENLLQERVSVPVEEVRKGIDKIKNKSSPAQSPRKKYGRGQTTGLRESMGKSYLGGKTFETMNSSDMGGPGKLMVPQISLDINPFVEIRSQEIEAIPLLRINQPQEIPEEDEEKLADRIINFTGNQLFEDKSEDLTDFSVKNSGMASVSSPRKSVHNKGKKNVGFRARFDDFETKEPEINEGKSPKSKIKIVDDNKNKTKGKDPAGTVNKEDLKIINKTLKDISKGVIGGADDYDDDSEKKTIRSTKIGARTIKTIKSMNKKTNANLTFTPKTHKLLDILRETIVKKLALEDNADKKEKAYEQSVHSSISSIYQSHRLTEKAITTEYLPNCYRKLRISLLLLVVLIFTLQISIYLIILNLYDGFRVNLQENVSYDSFFHNILQSIKGVFIYTVLQMPKITGNFSNIAYYEDYIYSSGAQQFKTILGLSKEMQLNFDFYNYLSPDLFTKKTLYNISLNNNSAVTQYITFPFELLKAVTLFLSELQKFLSKEDYSQTILLQNLFGFSSEIDSHDNFYGKREDLISYNKLVIISILAIISTIIVGIFLLRIYSHIICYRYMNNLLEMLAKVNYEDIETLKAYYLSISSVYDLQQELKGPENKQMLGINYLENPQNSKDNQNNKNRSHRLININYIKTPMYQIVFGNSLFALFIIGINLIVVFLSHGFDNYFEESGKLQRQIISQFNFQGYINGYLIAYDRSLSLGIYNFSKENIMDLLNEQLNTHSINESSLFTANSFVTYYLQIITNEPICNKINENNSQCRDILKGLLTKSLMNFEVEALNKLKVMTLDPISNDTELNTFLQWGEALDYALKLVDIIKNEYFQSEKSMYDSEINTLIIINCFSITCSFFIICLYYWFSLHKLAKRLIAIRKIYLQIPIAILMRQKRIRKYLQDTSKFYLGG